MKSIKVLKIGSLNIPRNRWEDSLKFFDLVTIACFSREIENTNFEYIKFNEKKLINKVFIKIIYLLNNHNFLAFLENIIFIIWRLICRDYINKISKIDFDIIHSSYNYFDESGIMTILLRNVIKDKKIYRAYKETRLNYSYIEKENIKLADIIVLNTIETKKILEKKYGKGIFDDKRIILNVDEDYRYSDVIKKKRNYKKLSSIDNMPHVVILAGECTSDCNNKVLGSRQYYIPLIQDMINNGIVVHIHTLKIRNDKNGINKYDSLKKENPDTFYIEKGLDFENNPDESYEILGRYDYGVLHNLTLDDDVSEFDKINISHRFYEYQIAKVVPIVEKETTIVEEKIIKDKKCGLVYTNFSELKEKLNERYEFYTPSFYDYLVSVYGNVLEKDIY